MIVNYVGGTAREHALVEVALASLINLGLDGYSITVTFEWVDDPSAEGHNDLASTTTAGTGTATVQLRNNLDEYKGYPESFYVETVVHELGHVLTRHLSPGGKAQVAALFDTDLAHIDNYDVVSVGVPWEDRPFEGIAETFKDAFLPQNLRLFSNRTNIRLPIYQYDAFRRIYRGGAAGDGRFCYVYGSSSFRVTDEWGIGLPLHLSASDAVAFVKYGHGADPPSGVEMNQFDESGEMMFSIRDAGGAT